MYVQAQHEKKAESLICKRETQDMSIISSSIYIVALEYIFLTKINIIRHDFIIVKR